MARGCGLNMTGRQKKLSGLLRNIINPKQPVENEGNSDVFTLPLPNS